MRAHHWEGRTRRRNCATRGERAKTETDGYCRLCSAVPEQARHHDPATEISDPAKPSVVPLSDGAGEVVSLGNKVKKFKRVAVNRLRPVIDPVFSFARVRDAYHYSCKETSSGKS